MGDPYIAAEQRRAATLKGDINVAEKQRRPVEGDQGLGPNTGARTAKGRAKCWVREGVAPSRSEGPGVSRTPENF